MQSALHACACELGEKLMRRDNNSLSMINFAESLSYFRSTPTFIREPRAKGYFAQMARE